MNREIKFRAWDSDAKEMELWQSLLETIEFSDLFRGFYPNLEMMQWTGLKDANGTYIYEGDIIGNSTTYKLTVAIEKGHTVIKWDFKAAYKQSEMITQNEIDEEYIEIYGNIYENPELLEEEPPCQP